MRAHPSGVIAVVLLTGIGCGYSSVSLASNKPVELFLVAHADDWQLFMGDIAVQAIRNGNAAVFVYLTAGDAGRVPAYWQARERGALASVGYALGVTPPDTAGALGDSRSHPVCSDTLIRTHFVRTCRMGNTASFFLRLPDGNLRGEGFPATGLRSLAQLQTGASALAPLHGGGEYRQWGELVEFVESLFDSELARLRASPRLVRLHASDPDTSFNPRDHADHRAAGRIAIAVSRSRHWRLAQYAGYSMTAWPSNLTAERFAQKAALFMAYDRERVLADTAWSAYRDAPRSYSAWLSRTYVRSGAPLHDSGLRIR